MKDGQIVETIESKRLKEAVHPYTKSLCGSEVCERAPILWHRALIIFIILPYDKRNHIFFQKEGLTMTAVKHEWRKHEKELYCLKQQAVQVTVPSMKFLVLEALWKQIEHTEQFDKNNLQYRVMIRQPDFVTPDVLEAAIMNVSKKKSLSRFKDVRLESIEGWGLRADIACRAL